MRIDSKDLDRMFQYAGIDKKDLYDALRKMGKKHLDTKFQETWTPDFPTRHYEYVVAEMVHTYLAPKGSQIKKLIVDKEVWGHVWNIWPNGFKIDLASEHWEDYDSLPWDKEKLVKNFYLPTPSKKARILATLLELEEDEDKQEQP